MDTQNKSGESPTEKKDGEQKAIVEQPKGNNMITSGVVVPIVQVPVIVIRGGLDGLALTNQLFIKQRIDIGEVLGRCERPNEYDVFGSMGTKLYFMEEDTNYCMVLCGGTQRPFSVTMYDHNHEPVFSVTKSCLSCYFGNDCYGQSVKVSLPDGTLLGAVQQRCNCHNPTFDVLDHQLTPVLKIRGDASLVCIWCRYTIMWCLETRRLNSCDMCRHHEFELLDLNDVKVGVIRKEWAGFLQEYFTDADNFGIEFPPFLDVTIKAVLLGAVILLDFLYFEDEK